MLVLTRKTSQTIQIGDNISLTVIQTHGNSVRIGIDAPRDLPILRGELQNEFQDQSFALSCCGEIR